MGVNWKDWCWSWNSNTLAAWCKELTDLKRPWCWERLRVVETGTTEDEMVGWHHRFNGHGFGWTPGVGDGQGGLACCGSWGCRESDTTERLNWTGVNNKIPFLLFTCGFIFTCIDKQGELLGFNTVKQHQFCYSAVYLIKSVLCILDLSLLSNIGGWQMPCFSQISLLNFSFLPWILAYCTLP